MRTIGNNTYLMGVTTYRVQIIVPKNKLISRKHIPDIGLSNSTRYSTGTKYCTFVNILTSYRFAGIWFT